MIIEVSPMVTAAHRLEFEAYSMFIKSSSVLLEASSIHGFHDRVPKVQPSEAYEDCNLSKNQEDLEDTPSNVWVGWFSKLRCTKYCSNVPTTVQQIQNIVKPLQIGQKRQHVGFCEQIFEELIVASS